MTVEIKEPQIDLREIDKWLLKEAAGCAIDDSNAHQYTYEYADCVLILDALSKKILGIYGVNIGNDPTRAIKLGMSNKPMDYEKSRAEINSSSLDDEKKQIQLELIKNQEVFAKKLEAETDPHAWACVKKLTKILESRALALERAGLLTCNVEGVAPEEAVRRDIEENGDGKFPMSGAVAITAKGIKCVSTQTWPTVKLKQRRGVDRVDEDVEVNYGLK